MKFIGQYDGIRRLWPPWGWLATNRPITFLTFAVNYALHGTQVWGYHAVNLAIHAAAACALLALVRDTLRSSAVQRMTLEGWKSSGLTASCCEFKAVTRR